nr:hypothetical protein [Tanacetum cinerariifolium]
DAADIKLRLLEQSAAVDRRCRNMTKEDLEVLWQLVKERFASSKPKNFSDDFMLTTLTYMFEKLMFKLKYGRIKGVFMD